MQTTAGPAGSRESFLLDLAASNSASKIKSPKGLESFEIVEINSLPKATREIWHLTGFTQKSKHGMYELHWDFIISVAHFLDSSNRQDMSMSKLRYF